MAIQNDTTLKGYFNAGDVPTESQFADLIDSKPNISEIETITGKWNFDNNAQDALVVSNGFGTDVLTVNTTNQRVGVGTQSTIDVPLDVVASGNYDIVKIESDSSSGTFIELNNTNVTPGPIGIKFEHSDTTQLELKYTSSELQIVNATIPKNVVRFNLAAATNSLVLDSFSRLGVGGVPTNYNLEVRSSTSSNLAIVAGNNTGDSTLYFGDSDNISVGRIVYKHTGDDIEIYQSTSKVIEINDGFMGIGTAAFPPDTRLHVAGQITIEPSSAISPFILSANAQGQLVTGLNADKVDGYEGSQLGVLSENETVTGTWNFVNTAFGTGTPDSASYVEIAGTGTAGQLMLTGAAATLLFHESDTTDTNIQLRLNGGDLSFQTNNDAFNSASTIATLDKNGKMSLGLSTPSVPLHISAGSPIIRLSDNDAGTDTAVAGYIEWYRGNTTNRVGWIGYGSPSSTELTIRNEISGADIIINPTSGKVGINKTGPIRPLDVDGIIRSSGGNGWIDMNYANGINGISLVSNESTGGWARAFRIYPNAAGSSGGIEFGVKGTAGAMDYGYLGSAWNDYLVYLDETNQRVGINTSPGRTFHVSDSTNVVARIQSTSNPVWMDFENSTTTSGSFDNRLGFDTADFILRAGGNEIFRGNGSTQRVVIGAATASYKLDVQENRSTYAMRIYNSNASADGLIIRLGQATPGTSDIYAIFQDSGGGLDGSITGDGSGGVNFNQTSDERFKDVISNIPEQQALDILNNVSAKRYREKNSSMNSKVNVGFLANELALYTEGVTTLFEEKDENDEVVDSYYMMDYSKMTPYIWAILQSHEKRIKQLERR